MSMACPIFQPPAQPPATAQCAERTAPEACTALIRTFNSAATLPMTLAWLQAQSCPPAAYVFVDSGSTDQTLQLLPPDATLCRYQGAEFNYSAAINQGLAQVRTPLVLVISSHTGLAHPQALAHAQAVLAADARAGAAYFTGAEPGGLRTEWIAADNFDGFNGIWNTAALIRVSLLRERAFRTDVAAAEDQEWSRWLLQERGGRIARIHNAGLRDANPRSRAPRKRLNEYLAVALYANPALLGWRHIGWVALGALKPTARRSLRERVFRLQLSLRLLACRCARPRLVSRYF